MMMTRTILSITMLAFWATLALGQNVGSYGRKPLPGETGPPAPENAKFTQKLGEMLPENLTFQDHDNNPVTIQGLANGKPTILILAYFRCPKLCNQVIGGVLEGLKELRKKDSTFVAGGPFNLVIVSIDPKEPVALARQRREIFLEEYDKRDPATSGVWFLTSNKGQGTDTKLLDQKIHQLANAVGYEYALRADGKDYTYSAEAGWKTKTGDPLRENVRQYDYLHSSGIVFLSPDGKITRYLLGISYEANSLKLATIEASGGKVGSFFDRNVSQYCYVYDDVKGHYSVTMRYVAIAFIPFMLGVVGMTYWTVRRAMREKPLTLPTQPLAAAGPVIPPEPTGR
jgi:protein SCO1